MAGVYSIVNLRNSYIIFCIVKEILKIYYIFLLCLAATYMQSLR